jgi:hypothetical protein
MPTQEETKKLKSLSQQARRVIKIKVKQEETRK